MTFHLADDVADVLAVALREEPAPAEAAVA
jgi:hypothetical protein